MVYADAQAFQQRVVRRNFPVDPAGLVRLLSYALDHPGAVVLAVVDVQPHRRPHKGRSRLRDSQRQRFPNGLAVGVEAQQPAHKAPAASVHPRRQPWPAGHAMTVQHKQIKYMVIAKPHVVHQFGLFAPYLAARLQLSALWQHSSQIAEPRPSRSSLSRIYTRFWLAAHQIAVVDPILRQQAQRPALTLVTPHGLIHQGIQLLLPKAGQVHGDISFAGALLLERTAYSHIIRQAGCADGVGFAACTASRTA